MPPYTLLIVESPAKCSKIESYLGDGYKCAASFGHIRELADGLKSIDIENNFNPSFKECADKKQQIDKLRKLIGSAKEVILASDDDREGEAIAWHICQLFGLPVDTTKRIVFHEITETALKKAVSNPSRLNMNIINAQMSRQVLDIIVGYKLSPLLWKYISRNTKNGLSAGRCQTPALRLVYDNQKEIEASPGKKVYTTTGYFTSHNLPFVLNHQYDNEEAMSTFLENSVNFDHLYTCGPLRDTVKPPPSPFTTSSLQQAANNEMRISPKETMKLCQTLYEAGLITYMRTDSTTYSKEFMETAWEYIGQTYGTEYVQSTADAGATAAEKSRDDDSENSDKIKIKIKSKSKSKKAKKVDVEVGGIKVQAAHEAIRPTDISISETELPDTLSAKEIKLYLLVRRNTLESCMVAATYKGFTAIVSAPNEHEYRYPVEQAIFKGWKIVALAGLEDTSKEFNYLQVLAVQKDKQDKQDKKDKNVIHYKKITSKVTIKDSKSHLSEAKLVQLLEQKGIGRPSTFSSLVDKIQERGYVKVDNVKGITMECTDYELEGEELAEIKVDREFGNEKNKLVIQPTGILVIDFIFKHFEPLFQYDYTKHMEDTLDSIAKGDKLWYELCRECMEQINILSNNLIVDKKASTNAEINGELNAEKKVELKVDKNHVYTIGKYGPVLKCTIGDKVSFKPVREDINMDKLKKGEYTLEELVVENKLTGHFLGMYDNKEVFLKNGKFGYYVEYGELKKAVRIGLKKPEEVSLDDIADVLFDSTSEKCFSRVIDENMSIRNGKFGDYIFYKKKTMKQPKFLKLAGFKEDYKTCELSILIKWINETYTL